MEVFLERMTWPEVERAISGGMRTAVICAASSEQHVGFAGSLTISASLLMDLLLRDALDPRLK